MEMNLPFLSLLIWAPILGGVWVLYAGDRQEHTVKILSLAVSVITFIISMLAYANFDTGTYAMQFVELSKWITTFNINYYSRCLRENIQSTVP